MVGAKCVGRSCNYKLHDWQVPPGSAHYTVDIGSGSGSTTTKFVHAFEEMVGSGHASLTLRADWRAHLTKASADLGVKRTRFHGLMDDDFSISLG
jgi:hypothetical protein